MTSIKNKNPTHDISNGIGPTAPESPVCADPKTPESPVCVEPTAPEIPVVVGPTASGKTEFAIDMAIAIGAEIVSADSMQVYRHMDIGTAKATPQAHKRVPHHMIDVVDPCVRFSVADYQKMAHACIDSILRRGRRVVIVGGTGLYISALINNIRYPPLASDPAYRERLGRMARQSGNDSLYAELNAVDAQAASRIHKNDLKRIIRALEVYHCTGRTISEHERLSRVEPPLYRYSLIGLNVGREELYRRIDARVEDMIKSGLVGEARMLYDFYGKSGTASQAIGYKELFNFFDGNCTLAEAAALIKRETRRYAKRQMTWFRSVPGINWIDAPNEAQ
ncbi:MAG: tRNA (adenosine(37)-N6)-dimethylallyltransferase MiaA [Oscillospiraceae bacterium]|nr:tRNA (adenosine(37)-N6)-dimethylallyltransferase MiaA [Oscillospiraceae bacterium]